MEQVPEHHSGPDLLEDRLFFTLPRVVDCRAWIFEAAASSWRIRSSPFTDYRVRSI